jgi:hypothetical protein
MSCSCERNRRAVASAVLGEKAIQDRLNLAPQHRALRKFLIWPQTETDTGKFLWLQMATLEQHLIATVAALPWGIVVPSVKWVTDRIVGTEQRA